MGDRVAFWLDPTVAMAMSLWLIWAWGRQALENIMALIGMSASPEHLQQLTYLCCNHSSQITKIDTVRWGLPFEMAPMQFRGTAHSENENNHL